MLRSRIDKKWMDRLVRIGALAALLAAGCSTTGEKAKAPRPVSLDAFARPVETLPAVEDGTGETWVAAAQTLAVPPTVAAASTPPL